MMRKGKDESAITLVTLVITVVILVIIVAVTLNVTVDQNIIDSATGATQDYKDAEVFQALNTILVSERSVYENGFITESQMWTNIQKSIEDNDELKQYGTVKINPNTKTDATENTVIVSLSIQVGEHIYGMSKEGMETGIGAVKIAADPKQYYGKTVSNYSATNSGVTTWEIFHSDGNNIYLIAEDYIPKSFAPAKNGVSPNTDTDTDYKVYFSSLLYQYNGASDIGNSNPARRWLSYLESEKGKDDWRYNMRVVAYLLDTPIWQGFAGEKAEYAIGTPTLDLFVASYNSLFSKPLNYIVSDKTDEYGYRIKEEGDSSYVVYKSKLSQGKPCTTDSTKAESMWIASASAHVGAKHILSAGKDENGGTIYDARYDTNKNCGLRPVVCLKANVQLEEQEDGTYHIK